MRFGLFLPAGQWPGQSPADALRRTVTLARAAEDAGFDEVWLAEHHFMTYGVCPSATVLAGHLLAATSRIAVGTAVAVLSARHPVALAEEAALLASLAPGRFLLGIGRGGPWRELEVLGTGLDRYDHAFPESLDLLLTCLTPTEPQESPERGHNTRAHDGGRADADARESAEHGPDARAWGGGRAVAAEGRFFRFREVPFVPVPEVAPPVFLACTSPASEELAARRGLPMLLGMHVGDAEKAEAIARYRALGGPREVGHVATGLAWVGRSRAEAQKTVRAELPRWMGPGLAGYVAVDGRPRQQRDAAAYAAELAEMHAVGDADDCTAALERACAVPGVERVVLLAECAADPRRVLENVRSLGRDVLPRLRVPVSSRAGAAAG
ncbi:LLM class flavin-dependent oxidoreductase [Actinocorallia sp. A-T 12471]|uniref:LLM class flavin-dependent oxidoreductase n=1 Tax=Actinocorallia sp. A-T 12471 TaxID=3089813 RepID=UPI0029CD165E|nr:LLM class flavin-dependent oxidoreductase [Actinocorallia sp. A-T 12471]MDX6743717.1 LLM class flavin-dependent oxidoreductase [Actinocorallia sp. A-T 12471]